MTGTNERIHTLDKRWAHIPAILPHGGWSQTRPPVAAGMPLLHAKIPARQHAALPDDPALPQRRHNGRHAGMAQPGMAEDQAAFQHILESMDLGLLVVGVNGRVKMCNGRALTMLDLPADLMERRATLEALLRHERAHNGHGDTPPWLLLQPGAPATFPLTYELTRPGGMILEVRSVRLSDGGTVHTLMDVTERKRSEESAAYRANHDALTGLTNRAHFRACLDDAIAGNTETGRPFAVLYLDLDRFKDVNDTHGHATGDRVLQTAAARMLGTVREGDIVARIGGDEFCIIARNVACLETARTLADRLLHNIGQPCAVNDQRVRVGLSIGIALFPQHGTGADGLLQNADAALYAAKQSGRNGWTMCDPGAA